MTTIRSNGGPINSDWNKSQTPKLPNNHWKKIDSDHTSTTKNLTSTSSIASCAEEQSAQHYHNATGEIVKVTSGAEK